MLTFHRTLFSPQLPQRLALCLFAFSFLGGGLGALGYGAAGLLETWREAGDDKLFYYAIWAFAGLVFSAIGAATLGYTIRVKRRTARLRAIGVRTEATVLAVQPSWLAINDVTQMKVRYRFRDALGRQHEAATGPIPPEEADAWKVGDVGVIYYDPDRPEDSTWTGERQAAERIMDEKRRGPEGRVPPTR
jgi:hypothetical protein